MCKSAVPLLDRELYGVLIDGNEIDSMHARTHALYECVYECMHAMHMHDRVGLRRSVCISLAQLKENSRVE